jgi:hypothetical protein
MGTFLATPLAVRIITSMRGTFLKALELRLVRNAFAPCENLPNLKDPILPQPLRVRMPIGERSAE